MSPSTEEIAAGQKAYQRIRLSGRYNKDQDRVSYALLWGFGIIVMGYFAYEEFHEGDYPLGVCFVAAIVGNLWQWRRQKVRYQKVFEFLRQLKLKYGPEIYLEIEKEPSSFYYNAFQKLHPPDSWRVSIKLP